MPPQRRSPRSRPNCSSKKKRSITAAEHNPGSKSANPRKQTRNSQKRISNKRVPANKQQKEGCPRVRPRPQVISLDVTSSSSSESSDVEEINPPISTIEGTPKHATVIEPVCKKRREGRGIMSSDSEGEESDTPITKPKNNHVQGTRKFSEDSESDDGDLYAVDFQADRCKAFQEVKQSFEEGKVLSDSEDKISFSSEKKKTDKFVKLMELYLEEDIDSSVCDLSSTNVSVVKSPSRIDVSSVQLKRLPNAKRNKKTSKTLAHLQAFSKRFQEESKESKDGFNDSIEDVCVIEDYSSSKIPIRVRWGMTYIKLSINKNEKFAILYQQLAERHKASVSQVVLSFKDVVISPESRPSDIGLSVADIIEGGILQETKEDDENNSAQVSSSTNTLCTDGLISLKVQTANRRDCVTLKISKYDKMSILMRNYAKLKCIDVSKLKFMFDGEKLEPSDSPSSLDLDGGECIDVYEL